MLKKNISKQTQEISIIKLDANIKKVKYIIHLADIHIKNDQSNRNEYDIVFERLYKKIQELDNLKNTIIVICGDIFDNKTNLKPESIDLLRNFFYNLCNITDCVVILGNHDQNSNNAKSLDALTPIINKSQSTKFNIFLLKNSGNYEYSNICFGVTDIHSNFVTEFSKEKPKEKPKEKIKISLYHGYIHGATMHSGSLNNQVGKFNQTDFAQSDITMLGDIHKFQYLNKAKTMAYPGSLLQLNYGEDIYNHGFILWNLEDKSSNFIKIPNDYAYYTIEMENGQIINPEYIPEQILPKKLRLRICYKETSANERLEVINKLKETHDLIQIDEIKQLNGLTIDFGDKNKKKIQGISNINNVIELILKYIKDNNKYEPEKLPEKMKEFSDELTQITKKIDYNFEKTKKNIKILNLEFNNMFIYGENNNINFENLSKIVGLIAENKKGKTSLIDCILFSIWSESDRTVNNLDVMKHGAKKMSSAICLKLNNTCYKICRQSYFSKNRLYNEVNLYEINNNAEPSLINLTESDKRKTEDKIFALFGSSENFTALSIITQDNPINFLTMKDIEKKALINKMFNLEIIKDINREVNREYLGLNKLIKEFEVLNKELDPIKLLQSKSILVNNKKEININYKNKDELRNKINKEIILLEHEFNKLNQNHDNTYNCNIRDLEEKLLEKTQELKKITNNIQEKILESEKEQLLLENTNKLLQDYINKNIDQEYKLWKQNKKDKLVELNNQYQELTDSKQPLKKLSKSEIKLNQELSLELEKIDSEIKSYEKKYSNADPTEKYIKKYEKRITKEQTIKAQLEKLLLDNNNINFNLKKLKEHRFNENCDACMSNSITKQKIFYTEELEKNINTEKILNTELLEHSNYLKENKKQYEKTICYNNNIIKKKQIKKDIKQYKKIQKEYDSNLEINNNINKLIEENRTNYNNCENTQHDNYIKYTELKELANTYNANINNMTNKINTIKIKSEKLSDENNNIIKIIEKYNLNKKTYTEIAEIKLNLDKNQTELNILDNECKEFGTKLMNIGKEISNLETKLEIYKKNTDIIEMNNKKKEILSIIKNATDSSGLIDEILKDSILPSIENIVNTILMDIDNYKIKIIYDGTIKIIKTENNTEQTSNGLMASGHEKSILNIIFRLAISKLNSFVTTNFFIIDEAFKNSDANKKQKLKTLFEYLRNNYDWVLLVSHDDYIKDNIDGEINIEHQNGTSLINF